MAEKETNQAEELVVVGPGADGEDIRDEGDERSDEETRGEAEDQEDERAGHSEQDDDDSDERDGRRSRRREERRRRKENRNRDRVELNFLRQRNESLERRQSELDSRVASGEMVMIDGRIAELDGQIREAERLQALAIDKQDGASATEAQRIATDLRSGRAHLINLKNQRQNAARTAPAPRVDPEIVAQAGEWASRHEWYDPNLRNPDSRVAKAIEDTLANEGKLDPRSPEYWDELDRRLKKYMPHRYGNGHRNVRDDDDRDDEREDRDQEREDVRTERRSRGPQVRVGGRERSLRKNEVYISAERKEAMIQAGAWDDPVLRERYLKQYQKYDRDSRNR